MVLLVLMSPDEKLMVSSYCLRGLNVLGRLGYICLVCEKVVPNSRLPTGVVCVCVCGWAALRVVFEALPSEGWNALPCLLLGVACGYVGGGTALGIGPE